MENKELENLIETSWSSRDEINERTVGKIKDAVEQTLNLLGDGSLRVAEKTSSGKWVVNQWTKKAVLLSFRLREMELQKGGSSQSCPLFFLSFQSSRNQGQAGFIQLAVSV